MNIHPIPSTWLADAKVEPVEGMSGATALRLRRAAGDCFVKIATDELRQEIVRTTWLRSHGIRVTPLLQTSDTVAALTAALPGIAAHECTRSAAEIVAALARAIADVHALPANLAVRLARARADILRGNVDPKQFDSRNVGLTPEQFYDRHEATVPASHELVVVHGDANFANILISAEGAVGFIDCGRTGLSDRYVDLALLVSEIDNYLGHEWISLFVETYGLDSWDRRKAAFFDDLYELF